MQDLSFFVTLIRFIRNKEVPLSYKVTTKKWNTEE